MFKFDKAMLVFMIVFLAHSQIIIRLIVRFYCVVQGRIVDNGTGARGLQSNR